MTKLRFAMIFMAIGAFTAGSSGQFASAQDGHSHDKESMEKTEKKISEALSKLSTEDQKLVASQRFCPIMTYDRLGAMGAPLKVMIEGKPVFLCCKDCTKDAMADGAKTLKTTQKLREVSEVLAKLPMEERMAIESQKYCAVAEGNFLGSMGAPIKLDLNGKSVYLCCGGCTKKAQANPAAMVAKVEKLKQAGLAKNHDHSDHKH